MLHARSEGQTADFSLRWCGIGVHEGRPHELLGAEFLFQQRAGCLQGKKCTILIGWSTTVKTIVWPSVKEFYYEIQGDQSPVSRQGIQGHQGMEGLSTWHLSTCTQVTRVNIVLEFSSHTGPPEEMGSGAECPEAAKVACQWGIVTDSAWGSPKGRDVGATPIP